MQEKEESMEAYTSTSLRIGNTRERERERERESFESKI
jgi:hypothetical protein